MQENTAKTAADWVFVARSLAQVPDGQSQALRCMARAGVAAESVTDWVAVASAWAQVFDDSEIAQQCMAKAESHAEDSDEWARIADVWVDMGDYSEAIRISRATVTPRPWRHLAELQRTHGNRSDGTSILDWLEPGMVESAPREMVEEVVEEAKEQMGTSYAGAIRVLVEADYFAEGCDVWALIAKTWNEVCPNSDIAIQYMEQAEAVVDIASDWVQIAKTWKYDFQDTGEAIRCLKAAENHGGGVDEWESILEFWKEDFQDTGNYLRCVQEAANDLNYPWDCIEPALYDEFVYDQFILEQATLVDLGFLTESIPTRIGIWGSACVSERRPGSYARYYRFTLPQAAEVTIILESNEGNFAHPCLYLVSGDSPNGEVLGEDFDGDYSLVSRNLAPGTYTVEATAHEEKQTEIFILRISVET